MQETRNNCFGYISALVLTCFRLKKGRATFFRPETIVASFLHSMVLLPKVLLNHSLVVDEQKNVYHIIRRKFIEIQNLYGWNRKLHLLSIPRLLYV